MNIQQRINAFNQLGQKINSLSPKELEEITHKAQSANPWFTPEMVQKAFSGIGFMLSEGKIDKWLDNYELKDEKIPKIVGIIMAGNIPLVGFHDLICTLLSGNFAAVKPSSEDHFLTQLMIDWITEIEQGFKKNIEVRDKLTQIDALIATGSDNTARYFEYYFREIPKIIRKNRTSIAILDGTESKEDLEKLGDDIFSYFGLGCRNVSKIFTPIGYDLSTVFPHFESYQEIINHHKYRNNYDYYKSIFLVNKTPHLDTGFLLTTSTDDLVSPLSVLYHQEYASKDSLEDALKSWSEKIQCIVGNVHIPFGKAQMPELWDYSDNIDVISFLTKEI